MNDIPMPDWSPPKGPWCLKSWLPLPSGAPASYVVCLRDVGHEGECRDQFGTWRNRSNSMFLGDHAGEHQ